MTKAIRIDAEAEDEISRAIDHYEREREGVGAAFWEELRAAMRTLGGPECRPVIGLPREDETVVRVVSVMHGHRRPAYWQRRI